MSKKLTQNRFVFDSFRLNKEAKTAEFNYTISQNGEDFAFTEKLYFPKNLPWREVPADILDNALSAIHLAMGTSYWKTFCSPEIEVMSSALDPRQAKFWNTLYTKGMGEFFYKNKIDPRNFINFPNSESDNSNKRALASDPTIPTSSKSLLLFGGGKDSLVSAELMKKAKKDFTFFFVASGGVADIVSKLLPKNSIIVRREIDAKLFELNKRPGVLNGHVPITAIIIFIAELTALLYDYTYVVASNERSSSYGNVKYLGEEINHQWSKSLEAEKMIQDYSVAYLTPAVKFFSLLRPFYEIKILEIFSKYSKYFSKFSSCNKNFKAISKNRIVGWCGHCPKCAFVFLMLAPFISKKKLIGIFGRNLLNDPALVPLFKELLGLENFKPFECVGTAEESRYALSEIIKSGKYAKDSVVADLLVEIDLASLKLWQTEKDLFKIHEDHLIPTEFMGAIKNI